MRWDVIEYGPRRKVVEIWRNDTGVTLANADNLFLETSGNARTYWAPAGDFGAGATIVGEAGLGAVSSTVDTIRGGPGLRRDCIFRVPTEAADRMFVEWRGELVSDATGFALQGSPGASYGPAYWWSSESAWATGTFIDDPSLGSSYLNEPQNVCWSSARYGARHSTLAGNVGGSTDTAAWGIVGGMQLVTRGFQTLDTNTTTPYNGTFSPVDQRAFSFYSNDGKLSHGGGSVIRISQGGLLWGYSATAPVTGADISRYPKAGDRLGWVYEVGYPKGHMYYNYHTTASTPISWQNLSIKGLSAVYFAVYTASPPTGAADAQRFLSFTGASMTVRGSIRVSLVYDGGRTSGGIL